MRADAPQPGRGRNPGVPGEKVIRMDLLGSAFVPACSMLSHIELPPSHGGIMNPVLRAAVLVRSLSSLIVTFPSAAHDDKARCEKLATVRFSTSASPPVQP